jgi:hypothetical protein
MRFSLTVIYWQQVGTNQEHSVSANAAVQHKTPTREMFGITPTREMFGIGLASGTESC